jgi:hypothetical protein
MLLALMDFLMAYEPDLLACAEALEIKPEALVEAHAGLTASNDTADWGA